MWWFQQGLCFLPAALVVWTSASFVFAYITAVLLRHVDPVLPYISDTGTTAPERCVFGIMLDVSAFLGVFTVYVRYKQVGALSSPLCLCFRSVHGVCAVQTGVFTVYVRYKQVGALCSDSRLLRLNRVGFGFGVLSSLGMCVVANFQKTAVFPVHLLGAVLTFGVGALYILVQTLISFWMQPEVHSKSQFRTRLILTLWTYCSITCMFISSVILYSSLPGVDVVHKLHWTPGETGYTAHLVSTVSEWSLAFSFISFFLTFIRDFQKIELRAEAVLQSPHLYDEPEGGAVPPRAPGEESPLLGGGT